MLRICSLVVLILCGGLPAAAVEIAGHARVIDGDTLDLAGQRIRIHGIDAPERSGSCRNAAGGDWSCGVWSQHEAERRYQGARIVCRDLGERTHDRVVAQCFHEGEDIALAMIRDGVVQACPRYALEHDHAHPYIDAEKEAEIAERGIFAGVAPVRAGFCMARGGRFLPAADVVEEGDCLIKGNVSGGGRIYHMPGQVDYGRINMNHPEKRWFCTRSEAEAAGWRRARR